MACISDVIKCLEVAAEVVGKDSHDIGADHDVIFLISSSRGDALTTSQKARLEEAGAHFSEEYDEQTEEGEK